MSQINDSQLRTLLGQIAIAETPFTLADVARVREEQRGAARDKALYIAMGYPIAQCQSALASELAQKLSSAGLSLPFAFEQVIPSAQAHNSTQRIDGVKNIIAVASGKGGVGKSTTAVNIALALAYEGARVGMLDADIYGPSQPQMLGVGAERPEVVDGKAMRPILAHGLQMISMGSLVNDNTPMVWRGPMVSGALKQLLTQTLWDNLDYLIVDMPPGTGDIQLTLSQSVPVSTSVIVTTPQDIALLDAKKGIEMFRKVNIPVAGVVENMAMHICSQCGHHEAIFGEHGADKLALEFTTQILGRLPLQKAIREQVDGGRPPLVIDPESEVSKIYRQIALKIAADIWLQSQSSQGPEISFSDD